MLSLNSLKLPKALNTVSQCNLYTSPRLRECSPQHRRSLAAPPLFCRHLGVSRAKAVTEHQPSCSSPVQPAALWERYRWIQTRTQEQFLSTMNHCTEHTHMPHPDSLISTSHTHTIRTHTLCVNHVHLYSWYLVEHLMLNDCKDSDSHLNIPPCCFTGTDCYPLCTVWQQRHHNKPKGKTEQFTTTGFHQQHHVLHIYLNISCLSCCRMLFTQHENATNLWYSYWLPSPIRDMAKSARLYVTHQVSPRDLCTLRSVCFNLSQTKLTSFTQCHLFSVPWCHSGWVNTAHGCPHLLP